MNKTFYWIFIAVFGITIVFLFANEIHAWMIRKDRQWRKELKELEEERKRKEDTNHEQTKAE